MRADRNESTTFVDRNARISGGSGYGTGMTMLSNHPVGPVEWVVSEAPADPSQATAIRRALAEWLETTAFDELARYDIALVVYEAMANAVEHAYPTHSSASTMTVRAAYSEADGGLQIAVSDYGQWKEREPDPLRGNGIPLMTRLSDDSSIQHTERGTTVLLNWNINSDKHTPA